MQQAWTYSKGMQKNILGTIPKGEKIITVEDMEGKGITVKKMWHNRVYRHDTLRGS